MPTRTPESRLHTRAPSRLLVALAAGAALLAGLAASGSAAVTRSTELTIGPIRAVFSDTFRKTTYSVPSVAETAKGATIFYEWTLVLQKVDPAQVIDYGCVNFGMLGGIGTTFTWHHGNADDPNYPAGCDHTKQGRYGHQGLISVIVSDDLGWHCSESYKGTFSSDPSSVRLGVASEPVCSTSLPPLTPLPPEETPAEKLLTRLAQLDGRLEEELAYLRRPGAVGGSVVGLDEAWNAVKAAFGTFPGTTLPIVDTLRRLKQIDHLLTAASLPAEAFTSAADDLDKLGKALSASPASASLGAKFEQLAQKMLALATKPKPGAKAPDAAYRAGLAKEKDALIAELPKSFGIPGAELYAKANAIDFALYYAGVLSDDGVRTTAPYIAKLEAARAAKQTLEAPVKAAVQH